MDVDDMRNLVVIGVANSAAEQQVRAEIKRLDVPMEAILVERVSPVVMDVTLRERVRPVPGGVQVMNSLGGICTLGVNLQRRDYGVSDGRRYFVTNSHCTGTQAAFGVVTGVGFGQPDLNNLIGTEVLDPPLFTNAQVSSCPPDRACRYSDAALIEYTNSSVSWDFAKVAQVYWPSLTLSSTWTRLSGQRDVFVGDLLQKIGRTTGLSGGRVDRGCARVPQFERAPDGRIVDTGRTMLCQVMSQYESGEGDSGSPVYVFKDEPAPRSADWVGIHWGRGADDFTGYTGAAVSTSRYINYDFRNRNQLTWVYYYAY